MDSVGAQILGLFPQAQGSFLKLATHHHQNPSHPFMGSEDCLGPEHSLLTYEVCCPVIQVLSSLCLSFCDGQMNMLTFLPPSCCSPGLMALGEGCRCSVVFADVPVVVGGGLNSSCGSNGSNTQVEVEAAGRGPQGSR